MSTKKRVGPGTTNNDFKQVGDALPKAVGDTIADIAKAVERKDRKHA